MGFFRPVTSQHSDWRLILVIVVCSEQGRISSYDFTSSSPISSCALAPVVSSIVARHVPTPATQTTMQCPGLLVTTPKRGRARPKRDYCIPTHSSDANGPLGYAVKHGMDERQQDRFTQYSTPTLSPPWPAVHKRRHVWAKLLHKCGVVGTKRGFARKLHAFSLPNWNAGGARANVSLWSQLAATKPPGGGRVMERTVWSNASTRPTRI